MKKIVLVLAGMLMVQMLTGQKQSGSKMKVLDLAEAFSRKEDVS